MEATMVLATKVDALADILNGLLRGDTGSILALVGIIGATGLLLALFVLFQKRRGEKLASAIGDCTFRFSPEGLFGALIWIIKGQKFGIPFNLAARRVSKGDYRTTLSFAKPPGVEFTPQIPNLNQSRPGVDCAMSIKETHEAVVLEYSGVGGDPAFISNVLAEWAVVVQRREGMLIDGKTTAASQPSYAGAPEVDSL